MCKFNSFVWVKLVSEYEFLTHRSVFFGDNTHLFSKRSSSVGSLDYFLPSHSGQVNSPSHTHTPTDN